MATVTDWIEGARLRTLPAAAAPVIVGSAAAHYLGGFDALRALLALVVALALQVGVNYANDYSDGIRGTDDNRKGPARLTGGGPVSYTHLTVSTGETAPTDDKHTHYNARFKCTIDFAYDGATPTTECTLDK